MSDSFDENGLQTATTPEILADLEQAFREIYGNDILLDSSTPDGQWLNILAQKGVDVRGLLMQVYNSFNPDNAQGAVLDQRCAINNIFRKAGTFTTVSIDITTDRTVTLEGVDENYNNPEATGYTIQDNEGNRFILVNTQTLSAGTTSVLFRSETMGNVVVLPDTITTPVTIVLGVISVNNPTTAAEIGTDEETDAELRIRRRQSVAINSYGYLNGLQAALLQLDGVNDAKVYENYTSSTDANGTPAHCVWVVMDGGSTADIANTIYSKKSVGCDMRGDITYTIITPAQTQFIAKWDEADITPFYIRFNIKPTEVGTTFDDDAIKAYIESNMSFKIGEWAETASITTIAQQAIDNNGGGGYAIDVQVSSGGSSAVTISGSGISSASVNNDTFQKAVSDTAGTYAFSYDGADWSLSGDTVDLEDYGITTEGTAVSGDSISVVWTASTWADYLMPVIASRYSISDISITEV